MLKIAFLFLVVTDIAHEPLWLQFFKGHEDQYSIYVHAKYPLSSDTFFKPHEMSTRVATTWSHTMRAQIAMLEQALKDPDNVKFAFVSETTIPLQSFDYAYAKLTEDDRSLFMYRPNPHLIVGTPEFNPSRNLAPLPATQQYKNYQWVVLNRKHAQMMVDDTYYIAITDQHGNDQEHYPSTFLAGHNCLHEINQVSTTYVYWPKPTPTKAPHPYAFSNFNDSNELNLMTNAIRNGYLFTRKITKECDVAPLLPFLVYCKQQ